MSYATRTDLEERYGATELTQRESMLATGAVAQALADADALIDGYLARRYKTPLDAPPSNLPRIACQLARYLILGNAADERARADYEDALAWLKDVAAGRVTLPCPPASAAAAPAATVELVSSERVFSRGSR